MHPILFSIPLPGGSSFDIATYGVMMALGTAAAVLLAMWVARRDGLSANAVVDMAFWAVIGGVVGAKAWFVVQNWGEFDDKWDLVRNFRSGLVYYGGLLGGMAAVYAYARRARLGIARVLDTLAAPAMLGLAFGRIGCFFNGCCYGSETASGLGVAYGKIVDGGLIIGSPAYLDQLAKNHISKDALTANPVLPVQLFEAGAVVAVVLTLLALRRTRRFYGEQAAMAFILYSAVRFTVEFFRGDNQSAAAGLTIPQIFSVAAFVAAAAILAYLRLAKPVSLAAARIGAPGDAKK